MRLIHYISVACIKWMEDFSEYRLPRRILHHIALRSHKRVSRSYKVVDWVTAAKYGITSNSFNSCTVTHRVWQENLLWRWTVQLSPTLILPQWYLRLFVENNKLPTHSSEATFGNSWRCSIYSKSWAYSTVKNFNVLSGKRKCIVMKLYNLSNTVFAERLASKAHWHHLLQRKDVLDIFDAKKIVTHLRQRKQVVLNDKKTTCIMYSSFPSPVQLGNSTLHTTYDFVPCLPAAESCTIRNTHSCAFLMRMFHSKHGAHSKFKKLSSYAILPLHPLKNPDFTLHLLSQENASWAFTYHLVYP